MVAAIRSSKGKILREFKDTVYIPYGEEYSIYLSNQNSLRCTVSVSIDGQDVADGQVFVLEANSNLDIKRFIRNGNLSEGNRFKFIERTKKIEDGPRGIKAEDGLVRIEFEFERRVERQISSDRIYDTWPGRNSNGIDPRLWNSSLGTFKSANLDFSDTGIDWSAAQGASSAQKFSRDGTLDLTNTVKSSVSYAATSVRASTGGAFRSMAPADADVGITVAGSISNQEFKTGEWFPTDGQKHVMVLKLMGTHEGTEVKEVVTVKTKKTCTTCGHVSPAMTKFCPECGTSLVLV